MKNLNSFLSIEHDIPKSVVDKVRKKYNIVGKESIKPIEFYALLVTSTGELRRIQ
jgi:hypothetical protein